MSTSECPPRSAHLGVSSTRHRPKGPLACIFFLYHIINTLMQLLTDMSVPRRAHQAKSLLAGIDLSTYHYKYATTSINIICTGCPLLSEEHNLELYKKRFIYHFFFPCRIPVLTNRTVFSLTFNLPIESNLKEFLLLSATHEANESSPRCYRRR